MRDSRLSFGSDPRAKLRLAFCSTFGWLGGGAGAGSFSVGFSYVDSVVVVVVPIG